jgi:hypothetical protein
MNNQICSVPKIYFRPLKIYFLSRSEKRVNKKKCLKSGKRPQTLRTHGRRQVGTSAKVDLEQKATNHTKNSKGPRNVSKRPLFGILYGRLLLSPVRITCISEMYPILLSKGLVGSILDYASVCYSGMARSHFLKLKRLQYRGLRIALGLM